MGGAGEVAAVKSAGVLIPDWKLPPGVHAAVSTRTLPGVSPSPFDGGNLGARCGDEADNVAANRAVLRRELALPGEPPWLRQVHGTEVHLATAPGDPARRHHDDPVADAVYAREPGLVCAVQTADCLPLLICSDDGREVAAVHAGWRGLAAGVIEATLARFAAPASRLRVWLGPAIAAASYEVGEDVRAAFIAADPHAEVAFSETRPGHWLCDLYELARQRLHAAGVADVSGGGFDTFTDARFYSHRRERPTGRFASLIWIEPGRAPLRAPDPLPALLFVQLLGPAAFAALPPTVQALHRRGGLRRYEGRVNIRRGRHWLARLCSAVTGMPPAMDDAPLQVEISAAPGRERWTRHFAGHRMSSAMTARDGRLCERLGPVTFHFRLDTDGGVLNWTVERVSALGLPLPVRWFSGVHAREFEQDGRYCFDVAAALPLAGELVHYRGWLRVDAQRDGAGLNASGVLAAAVVPDDVVGKTTDACHEAADAVGCDGDGGD